MGLRKGLRPLSRSPPLMTLAPRRGVAKGAPAPLALSPADDFGSATWGCERGSGPSRALPRWRGWPPPDPRQRKLVFACRPLSCLRCAHSRHHSRMQLGGGSLCIAVIQNAVISPVSPLRSGIPATKHEPLAYRIGRHLFGVQGQSPAGVGYPLGVVEPLVPAARSGTHAEASTAVQAGVQRHRLCRCPRRVTAFAAWCPQRLQWEL